MNQQLKPLLNAYEERILGQSKNLRLLLSAILSGGHVLIEGVPGTGKTQMVRTLSNLIGGEFKRIQFTPDLLPSDITGSTIFNMRENTFQTIKGPIFSNIVLADEINRTPAKTQAALLEAMEEKQVTIQGETYPFPMYFSLWRLKTRLSLKEPIPFQKRNRIVFYLN